MNFIVLFPYLKKYYNILFIIIILKLGCDRPCGILFFVPALLLSIHAAFFRQCNYKCTLWRLCIPRRISKDKSPSVWFLFCDVIFDLSKYKYHELVFNSCYKHALRCVMTMMVLDSYLLIKYFLALQRPVYSFRV